MGLFKHTVFFTFKPGVGGLGLLVQMMGLAIQSSCPYCRRENPGQATTVSNTNDKRLVDFQSIIYVFDHFQKIPGLIIIIELRSLMY